MFNFDTIAEDKRHIRKVQLGAGGSVDPNYINTDFYQSKTVDMVLDITKKMPFADPISRTESPLILFRNQGTSTVRSPQLILFLLYCYKA